MIYLKDSLHYERVLSQRYEFHYTDMSKCMKDFLDEAKDLGAHRNGPIFYALNNYPKDEIMKIEFFMPIKEEIATKGEMKFHSYYSVEQMMSTRVLSNFEENMEYAIASVIETINMMDSKQITPIYFVIDDVYGQQYVTIKIGYLGK